ncbi:MAG TPA: outer membrane lipoprotein-sorting protein [Candidatus Brocadiia bacterium]|nr:outer membrane lipoprotein-sorting protein [Candidatus Brocadiia bacterium]
MRKTVIRSATVFAAAALVAVVFSSVARAEDFAGLVGKAKAKQAKIDAEIKDLTIVQQMVGLMPPEAGGKKAKGGEPEKVTADMKAYIKGDKSRIESDMKIPGMEEQMKDLPPAMRAQIGGSMKTTIICDGKNAVMFSPMTGKRPLPEAQSREMSARRGWWEWMKTGTVTGEEKVGDREAIVVEATPESGKETPFTKIWIDKKTLQMIKGEAKNAREGVMTVTCSDFKKVQGELEIPYKTEMKQGDKLMSTVTVKSVEVNKGLADELFDPEKLKADKPAMPIPGGMMPGYKPGKK